MFWAASLKNSKFEFEFKSSPKGFSSDFSARDLLYENWGAAMWGPTGLAEKKFSELERFNASGLGINGCEESCWMFVFVFLFVLFPISKLYSICGISNLSVILKKIIII